MLKILILLALVNPFILVAQEPSQLVPSQLSAYSPVRKYDPARDGAADIANATQEAKRSGRRVLIQVGGNWASWCHVLDNFWDTHPELATYRDQNYVTVYVNYSRENQNKLLLAHYDQILEYPHLLVLDENGKLLASQWTSPLEMGDNYDPVKFRVFLSKWVPSRPHP